jgi:hypothetical protein
MLISLTEKQVGVLKYVLESEIERYEDRATTEEYDRCYEQANHWRLRAFEIKKIINEL